MKKFLIFVMVIGLMSTPLFAELKAHIKSTKGKVEIKLPLKGWQRAKVGMVIPKGATISTGFKSYAVLQLGDSILQVKQLTRMKLEELIQKKNIVSTKLFLKVGKIKAKVRTAKGLRANFKLRSPNSTAAVRGTEFEYDGKTLKVLEGTVHFVNLLNQSQDIGMGEESETDGYTPPTGGENGKLRHVRVRFNTSPALNFSHITKPWGNTPSFYGNITAVVEIPAK